MPMSDIRPFAVTHLQHVLHKRLTRSNMLIKFGPTLRSCGALAVLLQLWPI